MLFITGTDNKADSPLNCTIDSIDYRYAVSINRLTCKNDLIAVSRRLSWHRPDVCAHRRLLLHALAKTDQPLAGSELHGLDDVSPVSSWRGVARVSQAVLGWRIRVMMRMDKGDNVRIEVKIINFNLIHQSPVRTLTCITSATSMAPFNDSATTLGASNRP